MTSQTGYFVLADISGFTAYLAGVELEHAHSIVVDLLELLVARLAPPLRLAEVEGDAVLAYAPVQRLARGETLLELLEAAYAAFRERLVSMARRTTCTCRACRAVPQLDLKFTVHAGEYALQTVLRDSAARRRTRPELLGLAVDVVRQRWLKPAAAAATESRGYAVISALSLDRLGLSPGALGAQRLLAPAGPAGEVIAYCLDLHGRYAERLAARRARISAAMADAALVQDCSAPPAVVWDWLNDPLRRSRWMAGTHWSAGRRPAGRTGVGARNHCEHGAGTATETVVDWCPFDYFTVELRARPGRLTVLQTYELEPLPGGQGTRLHSRSVLQHPLPRWLARPLGRLATRLLLRPALARLAGLIAAEAQTALE
jgi:hypothetical protein